MKQIVLITATVLAFGLAFTACRKSETTLPDKPGSEHQTEAAKYACPMHPEVTDTKASKCPKCGMTLQPVKTSSLEHGPRPNATITVIPLLKEKLNPSMNS